MKTINYFLAFFGLLYLPQIVHAQGVPGAVDELHSVLEKVYDDMLPMTQDIISVCRALAILGALFYINARVWPKLSVGQPVELYPLLKPFVMIILIGMYPLTIKTINLLLKPTVDATAAIVKKNHDAIAVLTIAQAKAISGDPNSVLATPGSTTDPEWDKYAQPDPGAGTGSDIWSAIGDGFKFISGGMMNWIKWAIKLMISLFLELCYFAASLCIDAIRTFHMVVLSVLGPFAFAFSCFDGFQNSITTWLVRYVNVYLWLPVANILGATLSMIQINLLKVDLTRIQNGSGTYFSSTDMAYLLFLAIGVVCYFTVPGIANFIVSPSGGNSMLKKVTDKAESVSKSLAGGGQPMIPSGSGGSSGGVNQFGHNQISGS